MTNIFVGNLSFHTTQEDLMATFSQYGNVERASEREFQRGTRPPELVARVIVGAIESRRPKTRYRVAPLAKILVPLKGLASDRFLDRRLKRALKLPDSI